MGFAYHENNSGYHKTRNQYQHENQNSTHKSPCFESGELLNISSITN